MLPCFVWAQNVGIGTTTPLYKFHVAGGDQFFNTQSGAMHIGYPTGNQWSFSSIGAGSTLLMRSSPDATTFTTRHRFEQNGDVTLGSDEPDKNKALENTLQQINNRLGAIEEKNK